MYYIQQREQLDVAWAYLRNEQDGTRISFVSRDDASDSATELARGSSLQYVVVDEQERIQSLIYTGKNPYSNLI